MEKRQEQDQGCIQNAVSGDPGAKVKEIYLNSVFGAGQRWKANCETEKAVVQDGACYWENPVYEKVKLVREPKTGKIKENIYHFTVSSGSSKSGFLGEASIDFADFAEETEPVTIYLPLKFANSGAVLHVTIQNMQTDQREFEENGVPISSYDKSLKNQLSNSSIDESNQYSYFEDELLDDIKSPNLQSSLPANATLASSWEKNSNIEVGSLQNAEPQKRSSFGAMLTTRNAHQRSNTDWSLGSASDGSLGDPIHNLDEQLPKERSQDASGDLVEKLKSEIDNLTRQSALSELELQSLRKQIVKETKRSQTLSAQITSLREERDELKEEFEELRCFTKHNEEAEAASQLRLQYEEIMGQVDELRYELDHQKELNSNLRLQLQKTQDSNSELILEVSDLEEMVKEKSREISSLSLKIQNYKDLEDVETRRLKYNMNAERNGFQENLSERRNSVEMDSLKQKLEAMNNEIKLYKKNKQELETHLERLTLDHENLKQENQGMSARLEQINLQEDMNEEVECPRCSDHIRELDAHIYKLEEIVKRQAEELTESLVSINDLEIQLKGLQKEIDEQAQGFEEDLEAMTQAKVEQEQRAIRAEEALRKTRWKNAVTAERLQEEFKRLSVEMTTKLDESERVAVKAVTEASELRQQKKTLEEMLHKAKEELRIVKDQNAVELRDLSNQLAVKARQVDQMSLELDSKAEQLEHSQIHNRQISEGLSAELQMLRSEIEILRNEKSNFKEQEEEKAKLRDETEHANIEMLVQRWNDEREDLQNKFKSAKKDAEAATKELISMRLLKEEKENMVGSLESEVKSLMAKQTDLKSSLMKEELEKENLRKKINTLQRELTRKEEEVGNANETLRCSCKKYSSVSSSNKQPSSLLLETKDIAKIKEKVALLKEQIGINEKTTEASQLSAVKEDSLRNIIKDLERSMEHLRQRQQEVTYAGSQNGNSTASLKREAEICPGKQDQSDININGNCNSMELLAQLALFKEKNKLMEKELKDMEERYSEISLRFAEVEGERQQLVMTVRNLRNSKKN